MKRKPLPPPRPRAPIPLGIGEDGVPDGRPIVAVLSSIKARAERDRAAEISAREREQATA
jgi:hypothetical protein